MFKSLYDSPLVSTLLPCIVALALFVWAQRKRPVPRLYASVFSVAIAADAWLNNAWSPIKPGTAWVTVSSVFFVIFGDFRYFVVLEEAMPNRFRLVRAVAWAFVVPVTAQIFRWTIPRIEQDERSTFLLYEILFFILAAATQFLRVPRAKKTVMALRATQFELAQYGTWIVADVGLVLLGSDVFNLVRLAANMMYYVAFVPFMTRLLEE